MSEKYFVSAVQLRDDSDSIVKSERIYHYGAEELREKARTWVKVNKLVGKSITWQRLTLVDGEMQPVAGRKGRFMV